MPARLLTSVLLTAIWMAFGPHFSSTANLVLTLAVVIAFALNLRTAASARVILGSAIPLVALAVVVSPRDSHDVWSYAAYGRLLSAQNLNPYTHAPLDLTSGTLLAHVAPGWRHVPTVYGPFFTVVSAALSWIGGTSTLFQRILFQGLEAVALLATASMLGKRLNSTQPLLWLLLCPAALAMVNGGHNDLLAGCLVALAIDAMNRSRLSWFTGFALAAVLTKATAVVPVVAALLWLFSSQPRAALKVGMALAFVGVSAYMPFGGWQAIGNLFDNTAYSSRASIWSAPLALVDHKVATIGMGMAVIAALVMGLRRRLAAPELALVCTAAFLVFSPYVLPWYFGVALPLAALTTGKAGIAVQYLAGALVLAYVVPAGVMATGVAGALSAVWFPLTIAALLAGNLFGRECTERRDEAR